MNESQERKELTGKNRRNIWSLLSKLLGIALWAAFIIVCIINREKISTEGIVGLVPKDSWISVLVLFCLFAVKSVSVVVYSGILYAASGILFSLPIAIIVNIIGTVIMVSIPYFIGRKAGAQLVEHMIEKKPKLAVIRDFPHKNDLAFSFWVRIVGCLPGDLVCMYSGASKLNYWRYLIGSVLGSMSAVVSFAVMGMSADDITSPAFLISLGIEFSLMVVSVVFGLIWNYKKKSKRETEDI